MRHRCVNKQAPQPDEYQVRAESHPLYHCTGYKSGGDNCEGALECHEQQVRNLACASGLQAHIIEENVP